MWTHGLLYVKLWYIIYHVTTKNILLNKQHKKPKPSNLYRYHYQLCFLSSETTWPWAINSIQISMCLLFACALKIATFMAATPTTSTPTTPTAAPLPPPTPTPMQQLPLPWSYLPATTISTWRNFVMLSQPSNLAKAKWRRSRCCSPNSNFTMPATTTTTKQESAKDGHSSKNNNAQPSARDRNHPKHPNENYNNNNNRNAQPSARDANHPSAKLNNNHKTRDKTNVDDAHKLTVAGQWGLVDKKIKHK